MMSATAGFRQSDLTGLAHHRKGQSEKAGAWSRDAEIAASDLWCAEIW